MSLRKFFKRLFICCLILVLLASAAVAYGWFYWQKWMQTPLDLPSDGLYITVDQGETLGHLLQELSQKNIIEHAKILRRYAQFKQQTKVHRGEYFLPQGLTPERLLEKLNKGDVVIYHIRFGEGWTARQVLAVLRAEDKLTSDTKGLSPEDIAKKLGIESGHLEGWIFPDTYSFTRNTSDLELLRRAYERMHQLLEEKWQKRAENLPYKTPYEALIMASIVERETGAAHERDKVAGVFVRRLQRGMKLQTDPTVIYGMGEAYRGKIRRSDLTNPTAYNTYVITGLPPTPISMPGLASIEAALHPAPGDALYFVAKGDGTSEFSATLKEHNAAVRRYQLNRRSDYRSSP